MTLMSRRGMKYESMRLDDTPFLLVIRASFSILWHVKT